MKRKNKKAKKAILIITIFVTTLFMASGYSILKQSLKLTATVNLYSSERYLWKQLKENFVKENGSGFHETNENGKYVYIGNDEKNYIKIDDLLWRVMSIEKDNTVKIIQTNNEIIKKFDEENNRTESSTYCSDTSLGCNAWSQRSIFTNDTISGQVENNSSVLNYLNSTFYNSLSDSLKSKIVEHAYNIGPVSIDETTTMSNLLLQEQEVTWNGYIAIPTISDFIYPSNIDINTSILSQNLSVNYLTNLYSNNIKWTINPLKNDSSKLWVINYNKTLTTKDAKNQTETNPENENISYNYLVLPTMHLKDNVKLASGTGTIQDPFTIE